MTPTLFNPVDRFLHYCRIARLDKPIGTMLLVWPTLWALWLAGDGHPDGAILFIFIAGTFLMRSAGCAMNDIADRHFDGHVERTRERPLAAGAITVAEALTVAAFLAALAFVLVLRLNALTVWLSVVALMLSASYPLTKRFLPIPQAYLGIAFGFGIPMGFAAIQNTVPPAAWLMLLANVFWSVAYDTEYAMVDRPDDLKIGIRSSAITFGRFDVPAIMICYAATLGLLAFVGLLCQRGVLFYLGLCVAALIALYHYRLIAQRDRAKCFKAFMHNNWLGAVIFIGLALDYLFPF